MCLNYELIVDFLLYLVGEPMQSFMKRCWAHINLDALAHNLEHIQNIMPECSEVMAVVKANAYGHGDGIIAAELERLGVRWFCVSNIDEAISLRKYGIRGQILILGMTPVELCDLLIQYRLIQTVYSVEYARQLNERAAGFETQVECHLKVDTGMGRIGFVHHDQYDALEELLYVCGLPGLKAAGIFTHYAVADEKSSGSAAYTQKQLNAFRNILEKLEQKGIHLETVHTKNSAGIECLSNEEFPYVRAGIILYGLNPGGDVADEKLLPVMELKSVVSMVKTVGPETSISYGRHFISEHDMVVATVPVGYADGFSRSLSGRAEFLVRGQRARVIGTVCMDQLMLDVSHIPGVQMGDEVTIFGHDGKEHISADELACMASTINYEIICAVGHRVPRVYYKNNKVVDVVNYLYGEG